MQGSFVAARAQLTRSHTSVLSDAEKQAIRDAWLKKWVIQVAQWPVLCANYDDVDWDKVADEIWGQD